MRRPVDMPAGQQFGEDPATYAQFNLKGHNGEDYPCAIGTPVYAPEAGIIAISSNGATDPLTGAGVAGETVVMRGSYDHWLLHNSRRLVSFGEQVREGQIIAYSGNTGFTTGPHCHHGVRPLNPDVNNGYRGFINPELIYEEETMTATELNILAQIAWNTPVDGDDKFVKDYTGQSIIGTLSDVLNSEANVQLRTKAANFDHVQSALNSAYDRINASDPSAAKKILQDALDKLNKLGE